MSMTASAAAGIRHGTAAASPAAAPLYSKETLLNALEDILPLWTAIATHLDREAQIPAYDRALFDRITAKYKETINQLIPILQSSKAASDLAKLREIEGRLKIFPQLDGVFNAKPVAAKSTLTGRVTLLSTALNAAVTAATGVDSAERVVNVLEFRELLGKATEELLTSSEATDLLVETALTTQGTADALLAIFAPATHGKDSKKDKDGSKTDGSKGSSGTGTPPKTPPKWTTNKDGDIEIEGFGEYFIDKQGDLFKRQPNGHYVGQERFRTVAEAKVRLEALWRARPSASAAAAAASSLVPLPMPSNLTEWIARNGVATSFATFNQFRALDFDGGDARAPCTFTAAQFLVGALAPNAARPSTAALDTIVTNGKRQYVQFCEEIDLHRQKRAAVVLVRAAAKITCQGVDEGVLCATKKDDKWEIRCAGAIEQTISNQATAEDALRDHAAQLAAPPAALAFARAIYSTHYQLRQVGEFAERWQRYLPGTRLLSFDRASPHSQKSTAFINQNAGWAATMLTRVLEVQADQRGRGAEAFGVTLSTRGETSALAVVETASAQAVGTAVHTAILPSAPAWTLPMSSVVGAYAAHTEFRYFDSHGSHTILGRSEAYCLSFSSPDQTAHFLTYRYDWRDPQYAIGLADHRAEADMNKISLNFVVPA
jgi:hypothetical protein